MEEKQEKLSYEKLHEVAQQLSEQNKYLREEYDKVNYANLHKRMAYLFEIVKNPTVFDPTFVSNCVKEIQAAMTLQPEDNTAE